MKDPARAPLFVVLLPVKPPGRGKSRMVGMPDEQRRELAAAFALDTAAAALAARSVAAVLAVTDDHRFARELGDLGCAVIPDGVSGDLNGSLTQAAAEAARRWPHARAVALTADLPSLRPDDLDAVLAAVPGAPAYVADAAGTGTTLYTAEAGAFAPRFGAGSAAAHAGAGAVGLEAAPSVRRDVDDYADLGAALVLGVGPRTAAATGRTA